MERVLTDIDELSQAIRDSQSKSYMSEAILAYRMGARRLAMVGIWTAASYDIIAKIRELSSEGDLQAKQFIESLELAIRDEKVSDLQKIENDLISRAKSLGFIGSHDARALQRLKDDRNLCAHPAFSLNNALFEPSPEAVRAAIVQTIESLLSAPTISGKTILRDFEIDLPSTAFPRNRERAIEYVKIRYLGRMRPSVKNNFAKSILKALILKTEPTWSGYEESLINTLESIQRDDRVTFELGYLRDAAAMLERLQDEQLSEFARLIRVFPALLNVLQNTTRTRILSIVESAPFNDNMFDLIGLIGSDVDTAVLRRIEELDASEANEFLKKRPSPIFVDVIWRGVENARSFRGGEARLSNALILAEVMTGAEFAALVTLISQNSQVANSIKSPRILASITRIALSRGIASEPDWEGFGEKVASFGGYEAVWELLRDAKIYMKSGSSI